MQERRLYRLLPVAVVAVGAVSAVSWTVATVVPDLEIPDGFFTDFRTNVWDAGRAILDGRSPFREYTADGVRGSTYPPAAFVTTLPFALPPYRIGAVLWLLALILSVVLAMRVCGVRDWRCLMLALLCPPVLGGLAYGNVSILLVLAVAGMWFWRDQPMRVGILLGIVIAARLFLWPLILWLLLTGRRGAAGLTAASTVFASLIGWAAVAFRGIENFPDITRRNASEFVDQGASVVSMVANLGASPGVISLFTVIAGALALTIAWRRRQDDLACFTWTVTAALFASPIVWGHYYAVMLVPLALATPSLSRAWLLPYITIPQLTPSPVAGGRFFDATTGVAFAIITAWHCGGRGLTRGLPPERATVLETFPERY